MLWKLPYFLVENIYINTKRKKHDFQEPAAQSSLGNAPLLSVLSPWVPSVAHFIELE
jgi:hypothetical protein